MLLVKTEVRPSAIQGLGLFSAEFIPAGKVVWEFRDGIDYRISSGEVKGLPEPARSTLKRYCGFWGAGYVISGDNARYINHSETSNLRTSARPDVDVAIRDIQIGEELTEDYREFDEDFEYKLSAAAQPASVVSGVLSASDIQIIHDSIELGKEDGGIASLHVERLQALLAAYSVLQDDVKRLRESSQQHCSERDEWRRKYYEMERQKPAPVLSGEREAPMVVVTEENRTRALQEIRDMFGNRLGGIDRRAIETHAELLATRELLDSLAKPEGVESA